MSIDAIRALPVANLANDDALLWLWEHGTARVYVNTQLENRAALELYAASGFTLMPDGLLVLGGAL